jgi:adenosine deaminase
MFSLTIFISYYDLLKVELHVHLDGSFDELAMFAEAKAQLVKETHFTS